MYKARDLKEFDHGEIIWTHGPFNFQNCQRIRILPLDNPQVISRVHRLWGKTCNRINCKWQLILYKRDSWLSDLLYVVSETKHLIKIKYSEIRITVVQWVNGPCNTHISPYGIRDQQIYQQAYVITIAQCTPLGWKSCLGKRAQKMDSRGMETSCIEWWLSIPGISRRWEAESMPLGSWSHGSCVQVAALQGHGGSVMAVISWAFLRSLVFILISLNAIRYVELLGDHLHPFLSFCHPYGQQDNCSSNRFQFVTT